MNYATLFPAKTTQSGQLWDKSRTGVLPGLQTVRHDPETVNDRLEIAETIALRKRAYLYPTP